MTYPSRIVELEQSHLDLMEISAMYELDLVLDPNFFCVTKLLPHQAAEKGDTVKFQSDKTPIIPRSDITEESDISAARTNS